MNKPSFQPGGFSASPIERRARQYAQVVNLLFTRNELPGKMQSAYRGARHLSFDVRLSDPMKLDKALNLSEPLALSCGVPAILARRIEGVVSYQIELPSALWESYKRQDLSTPSAIGLGERRKPIIFELDPPHALIAGTSGSGKSETLKSALLALIATYSPAELGIILIDPHNEYSDFRNEAHLITLATDTQAIVQALAWVNQELSHRKSEDVKDGRIIIIAIGEASEALAGPQILIAQNVAKQARKYHMHLICETQKPTEKDLPGLLDNLLNRWIGQLSDAQTSARITGHAALGAHKLTGRGDFLHVTGPDVSRFQVALAGHADFDRLERVETAPVVTVPATPVELPESVEPRIGGRPGFCPDSPEIAAFYFVHGPAKISRGMAQTVLGLTRTQHETYRDYVLRFAVAYLKLTKQKGA